LPYKKLIFPDGQALPIALLTGITEQDVERLEHLQTAASHPTE